MKVIIIYSGKCDAAIEFAKAESKKQSVEVVFEEMDAYIASGKKLSEEKEYVVVFCADCEACPESIAENGKKMYAWLADPANAQGKVLCKVRYSVLGLGDAKKPSYLCAAKRVNALFLDLGATAFIPMGNSDASTADEDMKKWIPAMFEAAKASACCPSCTASCACPKDCACRTGGKCSVESGCCTCCKDCTCGDSCKCTKDSKCCKDCKCGEKCCCCCCGGDGSIDEATRVKLSLEARDRARASKGKYIEVCKDVYWIGAVDWNIRDFHGIETMRGSSYNAYLIMGANPTIVDSVKAPFAGVMLANLRALIDPRLVRYIVCNHAEQDHSSALPDIVDACPAAEILCNKKCIATLPLLYRGTCERAKFGVQSSWHELFADTCHNTHNSGDASTWRYREVRSGETFPLAEGQTLWFIDTPMVHWPESMFTYLLEERCLFSIDAFGQHIGSVERFDDELPAYGKNPTLSDLVERAHSFYANILPPFGKLITSVLGKFVKEVAKVEIVHDEGRALPRIIATAHGIIWRKHVDLIVSLYSRWAASTLLPRVVILYDTMYGATERMARAIAQGVHDYAGEDGKKAEAVILLASTEHITRTADESLEAACFAVGSPSFNNNYLPTLGSHLELIKGFRYVGRKALAFGSYGWAPTGQKALAETLKSSGLDLIQEQPITVQFSVTEAVLQKCYEAGKALAKAAVEKGVPYPAY